jgi:hypothetical protein
MEPMLKRLFAFTAFLFAIVLIGIGLMGGN